MKDSELQIDRSCHVLYSTPCKKEILAKITLHYPEVEREVVWEQVQLRYAELLSKWRTDLGGKKNFHNGVGGTYDCIAIMCFYDVCRDVVTFREMEEIEENLILPSFRKLRFVDINKPFWKKLMYRAFSTAQKHCDTWHDWDGASLQPGGAAAVRKTGAYKPGTHPTQQPAVQSSLHSRLYRLCAGLCLWDKRCKGLCSGFLAVTRYLVRYESHGPPVG